jgi:proline dehydrogenase
MSFLDSAIARTMPLVPKPIVGRVSRRYIAGESLEDALRYVAQLNARGMLATVDVLGEHIHRVEEATPAVEEYRRALAAFEQRRLQANISVKLTALGLLLDRETCIRNVAGLVEAAGRHGGFVRIDMEDSSCTDVTIEIYRTIRAGHSNVGMVLQSYMRRTRDDIRKLADLRPNVRLCKGIYNEPRAVAYKDRTLVQKNFTAALDDLFRAGCYVGIATHDELLVWEALDLIGRHGLRNDQYEFQMLLGVEEQLRQILVDGGHRLRVYVPFGRQWYAYSVRRLRENPKIGGYVFRNMFRRR